MPTHIFNTGLIDRFVSYILNAIRSPDVYFGENGTITAVEHQAVLQPTSNSTDVRRLALSGYKNTVRFKFDRVH
ncbi:BEM_HP_G0080750.mRNA.1.CDS.1 [Saccharomyces cerevisiae]|nr:BEM_HP_G0080750.mRNA.1.CDS.1 [Saccharomyces cerevisiae]CAI6992446.1 BEM_HP_G0080750.mRNA.1.CDS.1 [Saccharomyces cerevisiae]